MDEMEQEQKVGDEELRMTNKLAKYEKMDINKEIEIIS